MAHLTDSAEGDFRAGRLWSLADMLRIYADRYVALGSLFEAVKNNLHLAKEFGVARIEANQADLREALESMLVLSADLELPVFRRLIGKALQRLPASHQEIALLREALFAELGAHLFLYVPPHQAKYYERREFRDGIPRFPAASEELRAAANAIAADLPTAAIFHAMRAVEIGVRAMGTALGVTFSYPLHLAEWGKIVEQIEPKLVAMKAGTRSAEKDADLKFYSEAAAQFRHFNNAWRIRVSHARESYTDKQAREVIDHVQSFFETLSQRLSECP